MITNNTACASPPKTESSDRPTNPTASDGTIVESELCSPHYRLEYEAFSRYIMGRSIPLWSFMVLVGKSLLNLAEWTIRYVPGGFGFRLRYYYHKMFLKHLGKDVLIDVGVIFNGPKNISIGDYCWIDAYTRIDAMLGDVSLGKRIHVGSHAIIASRQPIVIGDYCGIGAGAKIYSNSEKPGAGKRLSGPMIPEEQKGFETKPIYIGRDCLVGANCVLLPGADMGEGSVVGPNSTLNKRLEPWTIAASGPPRIIGKRDPVTVPEV